MSKLGCFSVCGADPTLVPASQTARILSDRLHFEFFMPNPAFLPQVFILINILYPISVLALCLLLEELSTVEGLKVDQGNVVTDLQGQLGHLRYPHLTASKRVFLHQTLTPAPASAPFSACFLGCGS